jgi:uncharacterized sulfatase
MGRFLLPALLALLPLTSPAWAQDPPRKLNVLLIVSDDLNNHLGCYGNPIVKTPNIDRIARAGVRFDRAYCNYPVCNASRTSFLSGHYPDSTGVFNNATSPRIKLGMDFVFLPEYFRANGYFTTRVGKIAHTPFEDELRWDVSEYAQKGEKKEGKKLKKKDKVGKDGVPFAWEATDRKDEDEPDGRTARRIVQLLEQSKGKPFFIAAGLHRPHVPHTAPKKYFDMYPTDRIPTLLEPAGHTKSIPGIAHGQKYYPNLTVEQKKQIIAHYYAATTFMDAQVGVILEAMDRLKLWDNTIVIFMSDHGWHLGEHDAFWAKVSLMEESAKMPLLIAAPGKSRDSPCPRVVELVDLYPTLTELCKLKRPGGLQGQSLVPLLESPQRAWDGKAYTVVTRPGGLGRSVRTERWTFIAWPDGTTQLYDYSRDPREYVNLASEPAHTVTLRDMRKLLEQIRK